MSWEQALEKNTEIASTENEGFWLSHQVRNGKKTAILAIMEISSIFIPSKPRSLDNV